MYQKYLHRIKVWKVIESYFLCFSWQRITLPLPYVAMTPHVRFRWRQINFKEPNWAVDSGLYTIDINDRIELALKKMKMVLMHRDEKARN